MKILIFGLSGSGKTYLAEGLAKLLGCAHFNADAIRYMTNDWDFSTEGRKRQALRMRNMADFEASKGRVVVCDFICPTNHARDLFDADFTVWMDTVTKSDFKDTDAIFQKPDSVDFRITDWNEHNHRMIAECVLCKLGE